MRVSFNEELEVSVFFSLFILSVVESLSVSIFTSDDNAQCEKMLKDKRRMNLNFNLFIMNILNNHNTENKVRE